MTFTSIYNLMDIPVGETHLFPFTSKNEEMRIRKSAHNYNVRSDAYFSTRAKNGVIYPRRRV